MKEEVHEEMSFFEHVEILRWHILRSIVAITTFATIAFIYKKFVFDYIIYAPAQPDFFTNHMLAELANKFNLPSLAINTKPVDLKNIIMAGQFTTTLTVSFVAGIVAAFPYVMWEFWRFIKPALNTKEIKHSRGIIFFVSMLFILGVMFAYYIICPLSINFLANFKISNQVQNEINLGSYISTITSIVLAGGIIFELPIFIYFLSKIGIVSSDMLRKYRRHAIIGSLLLSAIITPPDAYSQLLVSIPLLLLYETGIIIARRIEKKNNKELTVIN